MNNNNSDIRFVAFLDILGFKNLVENNEHSKLLQLYNNLIIPNVQLSSALGQFKVIVNSEGKQIAVPDVSKAKISNVIISDSILCWTENSTMKSFIDLIIVVRNLLIMGFYSGLPLRGGISYGPFSLIKHAQSVGANITWMTLACVGKSIVHSYEIEEKQQWAGCIIDNALIEYYKNIYKDKLYDSSLATIEYLVEKNILIKYNVPLKNDTTEEFYTINWPKSVKDKPTEDIIKKAFLMHKKETADPDVTNKIENTISFMNFALKNR
jgi:hypothetical protein